MNKPIPIYEQLQEKLTELGPNDPLYEKPGDITKDEFYIDPEVYDRIIKKCGLIHGRSYNFVLNYFLNAVTTRIDERQKPSDLENKVVAK